MNSQHQDQKKKKTTTISRATGALFKRLSKERYPGPMVTYQQANWATNEHSSSTLIKHANKIFVLYKRRIMGNLG